MKKKLYCLYYIPIQGGHSGITKTLAKIKRHFYWKGMSKDIIQYIRKYPKYQMSKTSRHTETPLTLTETPEMVFDKIKEMNMQSL